MQNFAVNFLKNLQSKNTISSYKIDLEQFFSFYALHSGQEFSHPSQIGETICVMWINHLRKTGVKNRTIARKISTISTFLKFCQKEKLIKTNPIDLLNRPKTPHFGATNTLTKDECLHILNCLHKRIEYACLYNRMNQFKLWKKRYAIFYILFSVGMRVSELCHLKYENLEQIDSNVYRLHLSVKGNERHAPLIHERTAAVILDYMKTFSINQIGQSFFKNMSRLTVHNLIKKCVAISGINKNISPHSMRASLATHLHQTGVPLGHIKDLLNHKNIATTILYTRVSDEEMQENANLLDI